MLLALSDGYEQVIDILILIEDIIVPSLVIPNLHQFFFLDSEPFCLCFTDSCPLTLSFVSVFILGHGFWALIAWMNLVWLNPYPFSPSELNPSFYWVLPWASSLEVFSYAFSALNNYVFPSAILILAQEGSLSHSPGIYYIPTFWQAASRLWDLC